MNQAQQDAEARDPISNETIVRCQRCGELTNFADQPHYQAKAEALRRIAQALGFAADGYSLDSLARAVESRLRIRPSVLVFAMQMERVLHKHADRKGNQNGANGVQGWRDDPPSDLLEHLEEEAQELANAFERECPEIVAAEAIDIANMAMMVWDRLTERPDAQDPEDWDTRPAALD